MKISGIIFDMDGLMFDTERLGYNLMFNIVPSFGYEMPAEILGKTIGVNRKTAIEIFEQYFGSDFPADEILKLKRKMVDKHLMERGIPLKIGLIELLDFLESHKIKKAVATSSYRKVAEMVLSKAGIKDRFNVIICGDEVRDAKPSPEIFLRAKAALDLPAEEILILEDSRMGILAAHRAGIKSVMIPDILPPDEMSSRLYLKKFDSLIEFREYLSTKF